MSDISIIPETTLPDTSSEVRERAQRPVVMVRATPESPVDFRLEDEVHEIHDNVRRLATRLDGLEERFDGQFRRLEESIDGSDRTTHVQFNYVKEWCEGVAQTIGQVMGQLNDIRALMRPVRE